MRVGILANSYLAAFSIYGRLHDLPDCELYIVLSPSPHRAPGISILANFARMIFGALRPTSWQLSSVPFNRRVIFLPKTINHADSVAQLRRMNLDIGLHKSGVIYRETAIDAFRLGILNPHIGILPAYRGRNVMEWSILQGDPVGVTVFFVDAGIDTGKRIVVSEEVDISHCRSITEAKEFLFNLDAAFFRKALRVLTAGNTSFQVNDGSGRRYYVMSKLLQSVVQDLLRGNS
jgi:methionyl-tRNA formyltransferase